MVDQSLGIKLQLKNIGFGTAIEKVTAALKVEGFGVLTDIDVKETFRKKLDVDVPPYRILGACNPSLAYRALSSVPDVGLLLPCNVIVRELPNGEIEVGLIDPLIMMGVLSENEVLQSVAEEARTRLERVAAALRG